jgi:uncharacterized membrane protein
MPNSPSRLLIFLLVLAFMIGFVQFGLITIAFDKLGLSTEAAYELLLCTLVGSMINLPVFTVSADGGVPPSLPPLPMGLPFFRIQPYAGKVTIAVNVGGALIPVAFSFYLISHYPLDAATILASIAVVAFIAHRSSQPLRGVGIAMPMLVAPVAAALIAMLLAPEQPAPLAYIGGTFGVLFGADLLRLKDVRSLGAPVASIGGAGTFDGVFLTGLVAVLLA